MFEERVNDRSVFSPYRQQSSKICTECQHFLSLSADEKQHTLNMSAFSCEAANIPLPSIKHEMLESFHAGLFLKVIALKLFLDTVSSPPADNVTIRVAQITTWMRKKPREAA